MADQQYRIPLEAVESTSLKAIGWDKEKQILAVQFHSGEIFHHSNFTPELAQEFYTAESRGRFYNQHIRGRLPGLKMTGVCPNCGDKPGYIGDTCADCGTATYEDARPEVTNVG